MASRPLKHQGPWIRAVFIPALRKYFDSDSIVDFIHDTETRDDFKEFEKLVDKTEKEIKLQTHLPSLKKRWKEAENELKLKPIYEQDLRSILSIPGENRVYHFYRGAKDKREAVKNLILPKNLNLKSDSLVYGTSHRL